MPRFHFSLALAALVGAALFPCVATAAAKPSPSPLPTETASSNKDAGTIDGDVTAVDVTPGKSKMVVTAAGKSITFAVLAGTSVMVGKAGTPGDFAVDVKVGSHVSVSASKSPGGYTAQTVVVIPAVPAHPAH
jgi:hypothetical protein